MAFNPFNLFHKPRQRKEVLGIDDDAHYLLTWERKTMPSPGAMNYAWETYGLPAYGRDGRGNIHVERQSYVSGPANYVFQSVGVVGVPPAGILQGQFVTQPLMDPDAAVASGFVLPGALLNSAPNVIDKGAPVLSP